MVVDVLQPFGTGSGGFSQGGTTMPARDTAKVIPAAEGEFLFGGLPEAEVVSGSRAATTIAWETIAPANQHFVMGLLAKSLKSGGNRVIQPVDTDEQADVLGAYARAAVDVIPANPNYPRGYTVIATKVFQAKDGTWSAIPKTAEERAQRMHTGAQLGVSVKVQQKKGTASQG